MDKIYIKKSPVYRTGAKTNGLKTLLPLFPKNINTFYDVFGGSGVVAINANANKKVYNEYDTRLYNIIKYIKTTKSNDIIKNYNTSKELYYGSNPGEFFFNLKNLYNNDQTLIPELWHLSFMCFSNKLSFNLKGEVNSSFGQRLSEEKLKHIDNFKNIKITNKSFTCYIDKDYAADDFVFLDPPYYLSDKYGSKSYVEKWTEEQEDMLLEFMLKLSSNNIKFGLTNIIEYKGKTHDKLLNFARLNKLKIHVLTIVNYANGVKNSNYKEVYICNY